MFQYLLSLLRKTPRAPQLQGLEKLIDLARTEQNIEEVPQKVLDIIVRIFSPQIACIYIRKQSAPHYTIAASYPESFWSDPANRADFSEWPDDRGAIGRALRLQEPVFVENPEHDQRAGFYSPFARHIKREIVIPVFAFDSLAIRELGQAVLVISHSAGSYYSKTDRWLARNVQATLTTIYNRAISRERRERRLEFLRGIADFNQDHVDDLFKKFLQSLSQVIPSRLLTFWIYDNHHDVLVLRDFYPARFGKKIITFESFNSPVLDCSTALTGRCVTTKTTVVVRDPPKSEGLSDINLSRKLGLDWFISCPIANPADEVLGVVNIWPVGSHIDFDNETGMALSHYIRPAAATIRLSELLMSESILENLKSLQDLFFRFQDKQEDWDLLVNIIRELMHCEGCSLFMVEGDVLQLRGTTGLERDLPYNCIRYQLNEGLTGMSLTLNRPLPYYAELSSKYSEVHKSKYREQSVHKNKSILFGQLRSSNEIPFGIIRCTNKKQGAGCEIGRFTKADIILLERISGLVSHLHARALWIQSQDQEKKQRLNSLHHEILSPVEVFSVHSEWLRHHLEKRQQDRNFDIEAISRKIEDMTQNARLMEVLVTTLGRYDEGLCLEFKEISLPALAETCKSFLINEARRQRIKVDVDYLGVPRIQADESHLMRVIYNLLRNALKYKDALEQERAITISARRAQDLVTLIFSDNGIGVVEGEEDVIFEKFRRGSNAATSFPEGTGLGLHYCKVVIEAHGGKVRLTQKRKPTIFEIELPHPRAEVK